MIGFLTRYHVLGGAGSFEQKPVVAKPQWLNAEKLDEILENDSEYAKVGDTYRLVDDL